jgi:hypothetical protein
MTVIWFWETPGVKAHARQKGRRLRSVRCGSGRAGLDASTLPGHAMRNLQMPGGW